MRSSVADHGVASSLRVSPNSFLKSNLGGPTPADFEALKEEKNTLAAELEKVKGELAAAQSKIEELAAAPAAPTEEAPAE